MTDSHVNSNALIGRWTSDPDDTDSLSEFGRSTLVFGPDCKLVYIMHGEKKDDIVLLIYRVEAGIIITNQPSAPQEERTAFRITPEGALVLEFGGIPSRYLRMEEL